MPYKANSDRRHRIPKQRHRVTNWPSYEAGLRARGSLTVWFTAEATEARGAEPRTGRGGQPRYSDLAITTALTLRAVFRLALRQTEGLIASIIGLLGLDLAVPDHSTISRRAARHPAAGVIVPPRSSAVRSDTAETAPTQRDQHLQTITERGRMGWQRASGYNWRALVEADISRWKRVIGDGLRSQTDGRQEAEVAVAVDVLNRMLELGRPEYVRLT
ncbi:transposase [Roseomonas chloroacetimidivorans]|uniref:transposase n=1 Tax=Roseomonas chloroacetimidivorans TaxID=1766656 RepID=UPI003C75320F